MDSEEAEEDSRDSHDVDAAMDKDRDYKSASQEEDTEDEDAENSSEDEEVPYDVQVSNSDTRISFILL